MSSQRSEIVTCERCGLSGDHARGPIYCMGARLDSAQAERDRYREALERVERMSDEDERPDLALIAIGSTVAAALEGKKP